MSHSNTFVEIMDTTLRDGEQTQGVSFSPAEKANIAKALLKLLRVDRIEVASARVSEGEKEAVSNIIRWAISEGFHEKVEVLGFVDHKLSVDWIIETGGKVINLLTKGSEKHCSGQLRKTLQDHVADIKQTIAYAHKKGVSVNVYLEDWSNGYLDSPEYVFEMLSNLKESGIKRFMLPDTLGVLSPDQVFESFTDMIARFPWARFDFHPHNDYGLATANVVYAVKAGASGVHGTINCLGERAGNASLIEVAVALRDKLGKKISLDESHITQISEIVENFSGKKVAENTPIVGEDVFTQTSGIHADGDRKGNLYHNPIHPERFGRIRAYALGKMSGKASLKKNLDMLGLQLTEENQKKVLKRIVELGDLKKVITPEDLPFIITDVLESHEYNRFNLLNCSITSGLELEAVASLRIRIDDEKCSSTGNGNGGYDAFMNALKKILEKKKIELPHLVDYQIRIPKGGETSALTECVIIWTYDKVKRFKTIGVDSDQVIAAANATMKMLNLQNSGVKDQKPPAKKKSPSKKS